ncbi:hypothetical protein Plhal304r1_c024g0082051 [Plasmopara halstedii]
MSRFLAEPITIKTSKSIFASNMSIGKACMQGWRDTMEERQAPVFFFMLMRQLF